MWLTWKGFLDAVSLGMDQIHVRSYPIYLIVCPTMTMMFFSACHRCQAPFTYKGVEHSKCTNVDSAPENLWCPTAVTREGNALDQAWQFCHDDNNHAYESLTDNDNEDACKSRETLENLVKEFYDLSRKNPRDIAEELYSDGCPFYCHYTEYGTELMLKKRLTTLDRDRLQLVFEVPEDNRPTQYFNKDLDYSRDMFISDLGNGFGFLLGLSLFTVIRVFLKSASLFLKTLSNHLADGADTNWPIVLATFLVAKWTLTSGLVAILTISSIAEDFSELVAFQRQLSTDAVTLSESQLFNSEDSTNLTVGFSSRIKKIDGNSSCPLEIVLFDGFCDDAANNEECEFDGGDCCRQGAWQKPNSHRFCSDCKCQNDQLSGLDLGLLKPGTILEYVYILCT